MVEMTPKDVVVGDQYWRPNNDLPFGHITPEHDHKFDHGVIVTQGWFLLRKFDKRGRLTWFRQVAAKDYPDSKDFYEQVEYRGMKYRFDPSARNFDEVKKETKHDMVCLSKVGSFLCVNAFRDPISGEKVPEFNGNYAAFE